MELSMSFKNKHQSIFPFSYWPLLPFLCLSSFYRQWSSKHTNNSEKFQFIINSKKIAMIQLTLFMIPTSFIILSVVFYFYPHLLHERMRSENAIFDEMVDSKQVFSVAHRGGAFEGPENTMERFKEGEGVRHIVELDVCLTKDKKIVVCHDPNLLRLCGVDREVSSYNYEDLPPLLDSYQPYGREQLMKTTKNKMPLLQNVFNELPSTILNVQLKDFSHETMELLNALVKKCKRQNSIIWGMEGQQISKLRKLNPEVATAFQPSQVMKIVFLAITGLLPFATIRKGFIQIPLMCTQIKKNLEVDLKGFVKYATIIQYYLVSITARIFVPHLRKRGILTIFWTINDQKGFAEAIAIGGAGIITDQPSKLANYLRRRGLYYGDNTGSPSLSIKQ